MLQQLSPLDASFVYMESPTTPMHIASLAMYDGTDSPVAPLDEKKILAFFADRLNQWSKTRQRLVKVPLDADYPYWIEDREFDLSYHIRRIGLPKPASIEELHRLAARIFSRPMDMTRPLWEIYVIDGLDGLDGMGEGSFALLAKTHHAAVDGASGIHLMELLHDLQAEPRKPAPTGEPKLTDPYPTDFELMLRTGLNNLRQPFRFARVLAQSAGAVRETIKSFKPRELPSAQTVPKTRFNGKVSSQRVMRWSTFSVSDISALRKPVAGASINDAIITICAGGLRRYLEAKQELNANSLIAMAPINVRTEADKAAAGNQVSAMFVPIGTNIADPIERLAAVRRATRSSKELGQAVGAKALTDYSKFVPAYTAAMAARLMSNMAATNNPVFNLTITNVPGPQVPLYSMGARMTNSLGMAPLAQGMGLIMPITSYCGEIAIGFTSCRDMVPDPDFLKECIEASYTEFAAAAVTDAKVAAKMAKAEKAAAGDPEPKAKKSAAKKAAKKKRATKQEK